MSGIVLYSYVEDPPSVEVAMRILQYVNEVSAADFRFAEGFPSNQHGFGNIQRKLPSLLEMAKQGIPSFSITDLDRRECAPTLIRQWLKLPHEEINLPKGFVFRVAVREIEAWVLADRDNLAAFLGIPKTNFSRTPDELPDPKQHLLQIIQSKGKKKWHRDMLPQSPTASIGPLYNEKLCDFIKESWDVAHAATVSPSLCRTIKAFDKLSHE